MILNDPQATHRVQPSERDATAYLLKIPSVVDRVKYRHALRAAGAVRWSQIAMLGVLEEGVSAVLTDPDDAAQREELIASIGEYRERITSFATDVRNGEIDDGDPVEFLKVVAEQMRPPEIVNAIEVIIIDAYPRYASMVADREVYQEIAGLVAARMFLIGWEGLEADFRRTRNAVPDDVLGNISSQHLVLIGAHVEQLLEPSAERLRPLRSPSGGGPDPAPSNGTQTPPESDLSSTTGGNAPSSESRN